MNPATTNCAARIVIFHEKDGSLCFCVDFRKLNAITICDSYCLPHMEQCIETLKEETVFLALEAKYEFWKMGIDESDRDETAFTSHHEIRIFIGTPYRLKKARAAIKRDMYVILVSVSRQFSLVYLEEMVFLSKSPRDHIEQVRRIRRLLYRDVVTLNPDKFRLFAENMNNLGPSIRPGRL